jgi:hypothetical protein
LPMGGDLEYADEVTLARALEGRRELWPYTLSPLKDFLPQTLLRTIIQRDYSTDYWDC